MNLQSSFIDLSRIGHVRRDLRNEERARLMEEINAAVNPLYEVLTLLWADAIGENMGRLVRYLFQNRDESGLCGFPFQVATDEEIIDAIIEGGPENPGAIFKTFDSWKIRAEEMAGEYLRFLKAIEEKKFLPRHPDLQ